MDDDGEIVARPSMNLEISGLVPPSPIEVYEKMDGSLVVMFFVNGEPFFCTKGNFTSEQAVKAKEIFQTKYDYTYCFEVIYPDHCQL